MLTRIILDVGLRSKLLELTPPLELCDESGQMRARVRPLSDPALYEWFGTADQ